jgi:flagellar hook-associated protein FlgK
MNKVLMKRNAALFLSLTLVVVFSIACSKSANNSKSTSRTTNAGQTTSGTTTTTTSSGTTASGPTAALRGYYQAAIDKDVEAAKRYLSSGTMKMLEDEARKQNKSLDEALKEGATRTPITALPEFENEKISGDTATVDVKTQGITITMPMVKENGEWKMAMDKFIEDMKKAMGDMKESADDEK